MCVASTRHPGRDAARLEQQVPRTARAASPVPDDAHADRIAPYRAMGESDLGDRFLCQGR